MSKVISTLSLAKRAGRLAIGFDAVKESVIKKLAYLVVVTGDISKGTYEKVIQFSSGIPVVELSYTQEDIEKVFKKRFVVAAVTDSNFKELLIKALKEDI